MACLNKNYIYYLHGRGADKNDIDEWIDSVFPERVDPFFDNLDYYFFEFDNSHSLVNNDIVDILTTEELNEIRNENVFLVCKNRLEAFISIIEPLYEQIVIKHQINPEKLILLTNSQNIHKHVIKTAKKYNMPPLQSKIICDCERSVSDNLYNFNVDLKIKYPKIENIKKCFLNFNRRWRPHRPMIVALMKIKNLLDKGYVSLQENVENIDEYTWDFFTTFSIDYCIKNDHLKQMFVENKEVIKNIPPLTIDVDNFDESPWYLTESSLKYHNETYFSVVTETYYHKFYENHCIHLSEKTFKPIAHKHPFIIVSTPHFLSRLKELGYQTFSPYIDESYDDEEDDDLRMIKIVDEIERLCNLSQEQLKEFLAACEPICNYNYHLLETRGTRFYWNLPPEQARKKYLY